VTTFLGGTVLLHAIFTGYPDLRGMKPAPMLAHSGALSITADIRSAEIHPPSSASRVIKVRLRTGKQVFRVEGCRVVSHCLNTGLVFNVCVSHCPTLYVISLIDRVVRRG
jgi:hypothetical protein